MKYIPLAIGILIGASLATGIGQARVWWTNKQHASEIASVQAQCLENQRITEGLTHEYLEQIDLLNQRIRRLDRVYDLSKCVPVAFPACADNARSGAEVSGRDGIDPKRLLDFAGECDLNTITLQACQRYVEIVQDIAGQK